MAGNNIKSNVLQSHFEMIDKNHMDIPWHDYTQNNKHVVMTVVKREQARNLRNYVHKVDPDAFMMITNSSEIIGKGFIE